MAATDMMSAQRCWTSSIEHETLTLPRMVQFMMREEACQSSGSSGGLCRGHATIDGYGSGRIHGGRINAPSVVVGC